MKIKLFYLNIAFLVIIIIVAAFFRFHQLSAVPPQPSLDEASIGYNAYSILKTGADEYGNKFPILLRAYDDWRPALYVYMVIPFIKVLGLNVLAVRLPSAILSVISVVAMYFLTKRLLQGKLKTQNTKLKTTTQSVKVNNILEIGNIQQEIIALFVTVMMAISPWHIYISRLGHEVNPAISLFIIAVTFFLYSIQNLKITNIKFFYISIICFALSFDMYQSTKIVIPLFLLLLCTLYYKQLIRSIKNIIIPLIVAFIITLPILISSFQPNAMIRFKATSIFNTPEDVNIRNAQKLIEYKSKHDYINYFFTNRRIYPITSFAKSFSSHFNYQWMIINQGNNGREEFKVPGFGLLYSFEIIFMLLGIVFLVYKEAWRLLSLFISWLIIGIMPSAMSINAPQPMRAFSMIGAIQILEGFGIILILLYIRKYSLLNKLLILVIIVLISFYAIIFYKGYFNDFKRYNSDQFQYGILSAMLDAQRVENNYNYVLVSNRDNLRASYMYYLFSSQYDPLQYQQNGGTKTGWFETEHHIGKYIFTDQNVFMTPKSVLAVVPAYKLPEEYTLMKKINYLDGREAIWIGEKR